MDKAKVAAILADYFREWITGRPDLEVTPEWVELMARKALQSLAVVHNNRAITKLAGDQRWMKRVVENAVSEARRYRGSRVGPGAAGGEAGGGGTA